MPGGSSGTWLYGPTKVPQADSQGLSVVQRLREEFLRLIRRSHRKESGPLSISPEDLAQHWYNLAENDRVQRGQGPLTTKEKQVIALRVSQALQEMDLKGNGKIDMDEWVHYMLLSQSSIPAIKAPQHINAMIKIALQEHPRIVHDLQRMFEVADAGHTGSLCQDDIADVYNRRLWRLRATDDGSMLSDADFQKNDTEQLAWELVEAMDVDSNERITYGEFMAYCVGRRKREVVLHMYDLSSGAASSISPFLLGERLGGIWHTGIVVYGKEYYFGGEIYYDTPGKTCFGLPVKRIPLGNTLWRQEELHALIVQDLKPIYCREAYDVIFHNCNHFSNRICEWLTGHALPDEVLRQPEKLMQCAFTRAARPLLNRWLTGFEPEKQAPWKGVAAGGSGSSMTCAVQEPMKPGLVVAIQPASGYGPSVLGAVMSPRHAEEENPRSPSKNSTSTPSAEVSDCWVRYFGAPTSSRGYRGAVQTELFPCERLRPVRLSDLGAANASYHSALRVMMAASPEEASQEGQQQASTDIAKLSSSASRPSNCTPSSSRGTRSCGPGASRGLSPASTMVPDSMLEGPSSPRLSECSSDQMGRAAELEEELEGLAAELRLSRDDLKSFVLQDFLPEDWQEADAEGIDEASLQAYAFQDDPLLEQLPDVLQVPAERPSESPQVGVLVAWPTPVPAEPPSEDPQSTAVPDERPIAWPPPVLAERPSESPQSTAVPDERPIAWPPAEWPPVTWPSQKWLPAEQLPAEQLVNETPREEHPLLADAHLASTEEWPDMEWAEETKMPTSNEPSTTTCDPSDPTLEVPVEALP